MPTLSLSSRRIDEDAPRGQDTPPPPSPLEQFADEVGLAAHERDALTQGRPFVGPGGLLCRVHRNDSPAALRPEVLLPMSVAELGITELNRLLTMQSFLLSELGWYLGPDAEGVLTVSAVQWIASAEDAAGALGFASLLARDALAALIGTEPRDGT
jgi:hypothetical protein